MAHKKGGGSTTNGRDSTSKRLGVKKYSGSKVLAGLGNDHTIFSKIEGYVCFERKDKYRRQVSVYAQRPNF